MPANTTVRAPHPVPPLDWAALVPTVIHPVKVQIVEAMQWIERPLSATELEQILDEKMGLSAIAYHVKMLKKWGVLKQVRKRQVRGSVERFYFLAAKRFPSGASS